MNRKIRTSLEIEEDLYRAFKQTGGVLSTLVKDAMRAHIGIKGASEESLAVLELRRDRITEEKILSEKKVLEYTSALSMLEHQIGKIKQGIKEIDKMNEQARIMKEEVNPYLRGLKYELKSITPELNEILSKLKELGLEHNLESLQKQCGLLRDTDYLREHFK